jgi:hypothetical protein
VPLTRRNRHSPPRFSLCPARPEHPLCSGDGLGTPDTVLGRAGRNEALERATENDFLSNTHFRWLFGYRGLASSFQKTSFRLIFRETSFTDYSVKNQFIENRVWIPKV